MPEIESTYTPNAVEAKWYDFWLKHECFTARPERVSESRPAYSIAIPPPNVTGVLTLGHVLNNTIQDILARRARMLGKEVLWLPGTDHAGIATQNVVERALRKEGAMKHRDDLGREALVGKIWEWKEKYGGIILQQLRALGCSCDWSRTRFTMDEEYSRCVSRVFVYLYKKGLIYRGKRMVNWCPVALTALSDEEVIMKPTQGLLYYFKVEVVEHPGRFLTIATTRPETIPGDTAIAVNPKDERYAALIGKHVRRPLPRGYQHPIPIVGDDDVTFDFGTGVLKVTPAHDKVDFEIGQRHGLAAVEVIDARGTMTVNAGPELDGLDRFEARKVAADLLRELGALEKEEPYQNNVGYSERADVPIEPRLSEQWFLKYPSVEEARACVEQEKKEGAPGGESLAPHPAEGKLDVQPAPDAQAANHDTALTFRRYVFADTQSLLTPFAGDKGAETPCELNSDSFQEMRFYPPRWAKVYDHWMTGIQDWCISRQLWWGHRVPVWYRRIDASALEKTTVIVREEWDTIAGSTGRELRNNAWRYAEMHGLLGSDYLNLDCNFDITVKRASLAHAFRNKGLANIKLVPALPSLLRHAVRVAIVEHEPVVDEILRVHILVAALQLGYAAFRVKFVIKEFRNGRKLYDHHAIEAKKVETDGKYRPEEARLAASFAPWPASVSALKVSELLGDVNRDEGFTRCQIDSPGAGWTQDPDVLDTWFSSWLWPFATMGWPKKTDTLAKFYPTTDLVTGPDIIFFWVARMIMAGFEWMGEMPFRNVYFTGIIRDKQGRKMSKSLGNSPDPLDLIAKFGADALRFGVMRSAPLGADILFDEKNVELGRNFCTKLWNAARFRQMQGGATEAEIRPDLLTSDDKWILLRLDAAIREVSRALDEYRFSDAAQALYGFFWQEYCDWFLEASKASLPSPSFSASSSSSWPATEAGGEKDEDEEKENEGSLRAANTLAVMDFVLAHTVRLFHPFLPFITEELWHGLGFSADMPAEQGGTTIMTAPWPQPLTAEEREYFSLDESDERYAAAKYEVVNLGRGLRRDGNIASNKRVRFVFRPTAELPAHEAAVLRILLNAEPLDLANAAWTAPKGTPTALTPLGELFLPLEGLIDVAAERERLGKELAKVEDELAKVRAKLADPDFTEKVPAKVLEDHRQREAAWAEKLAQLGKMRDALG